MRKVLHKVKSQWVVLGVMGAMMVALGTMNVQQVSAAELDGVAIGEISELSGYTSEPNEPVTISTEETSVEEVPYATVEIADNELEEGKTEVRQTGVNGAQNNMYAVTYTDGVETSRTLISSVVTTTATDEIIAVGTKDVTAPAIDESSINLSKTAEGIQAPAALEEVTGFAFAASATMEMQEAPAVNLTAEGTVSTSVPFDNLAYATDSQTANTVEYARGTSGLQWMQVDLGAAYDLNAINLWHYYGDGRSYHDVIVQLANDTTFANGAVTVFNNDTNGSAGLGVGTDSEYRETSAGKTIAFDTITARYARFYSNGSTVNGANHYVEVEIYGVEPQTAPTVNLVPEGTFSSSVPFDNLTYAADAKADNTANYARGTNGLQWVQVDLGAAYDLNAINLWHYYGDGRSYHDVIVQLSNDATFSSGVVTVFNNDTNGSAGLGVGTDSEYRETSAGKTISFDTVNARYARFYSNGSTVNGANHYVEIEVYGAEPQAAPTVNLAPEGTVSSSVPFDNSSYAADAKADNTANYARGTNGLQWMQLDLGAAYDLNEINLWHYFGDGRSYHDVIVQLSNDASFSRGAVTVFNNDTNGNAGLGVGTDSEYRETSAGKMIAFDTITARYARFYSNGSTVNGANHYVEIEVYGAEPQAAPTVNLAPKGTVSSSVKFDNLAYAADAKADNTANYARGTNGLQWMQLDLGEAYDLNEIQLWHYYGDGRSYRDVVVQLSNDATFSNGAVTVFNNDKDGSAGLGVGTDSEYSETSAGKTISFDTVTARYARFYSNGSTVNGANHYVEIEVYGAEAQTPPTVNLAPEGTFSSSVPFYNRSFATDKLADDTTVYARGTSGLQWMQLDLGAAYDLNEINLWHYYGDGRSYHDVIVQLSNEASFSRGAVTVFNNDTNGSAGLGAGSDSEYRETSAGKTISFDTVNARYARFYSNGNTVNGANHYVEIEVLGTQGAAKSVTVTAAGDTSIVLNGKTIQMNATITSEETTEASVIWSVEDGTGTATIDEQGLLTATAAGTVTVKASAKGGLNILGVKEITVAVPVTVTGYTGTETEIEIPEVLMGTQKGETNNYDGFTITENLDADKLGIVTDIGFNAFYNKQLTSVVIPDSVTSIGHLAFSGNQLASIEIPDSVISIGNSAFSYNQLTSLEIPDSVTSIGDSAFSSNQLTSVVIPESLTFIGSYIFRDNQLTSVVIPDSVISIGAYAFEDNELTSVVISEGVTSIGDSAFSGNQLTGVLIPASVTSIGSSAFGYNQLTSILIPASVTSIGAHAFIGNKLTSIEIPASVTSIGDSAFYRNKLTSVVISEGVTSIGDGAFGYNQLTNIEIPSSVISIGDSAFWANQLTSIKIPSSVTNIGADAFWANQLTSVEIPSSVTSIGAYAFVGNKLTSVVISEGVTSIGDSAFWSNQLTSVEIPSSVTNIGNSAFMANQLRNLVIPEGVTSIGAYAFSSNQLTSIVIPSSVTSIGSYAFIQNLINSITIGEGVTIGETLLGMNNNICTAYTTGGAGTYTGTQDGEWVKTSI